MLLEIMEHIDRSFVETIDRGTFTIENERLITDVAYVKGQYIRIVGSFNNDGIYKLTDTLYTLTGAEDETWTGAVAGLRIPPDFLKLAEEIKEWHERAKGNPNYGLLTSENVKNWSGSMATNKDGAVVRWQDHFRQDLKRYRNAMFKEAIL